MSILYQKARLLGRMFRGGYEGEGTGVNSDGTGDGPGSGWGASSGASLAKPGAKPGEDNIAQAAAAGPTGPSYNLDGMSNQQRSDLGFGAAEGFNPHSPTQTVDEMLASQNVNKALSFGLPMAASMMVPGAGYAMTGMKLGSKMMAGAPVSEILADIAPGIINGKLNALSGGLYGQAGMVSNLSGYLGGPTMPNVGKEIATGILGGGSGKSYAGATTEQAPRESDSGREYAQQGEPAAAQPAAAQPAQPDLDVTFASLGVDSAGWTAAARKYTGAKA